MTRKYKVYRTHDFIRKTPHGEIDRDSSMQVMRGLAAAVNYHKDHNILLDLRDTTTVQSLEEMTLAIMEFMNCCPDFSNKAAFVAPDKIERKRRGAIVKAILEQNAKATVETFADYEEAIEWLSDVVEEYGD